jgi:hypothetical protein
VQVEAEEQDLDSVALLLVLLGAQAAVEQVDFTAVEAEPV